MGIRRQWTPEEADEWTKEDLYACILSPLVYALMMVGTALALLLQPVGYIILIISILLTVVMFWIIGPKLSMISTEYEKKQKEYLETLEKLERWEE